MNERNYVVNSLVKALNILEALAGQGPMSIAMLHSGLGLDKGTLHRMLSTLKLQGYVRQCPDTQRYALTYKMFQLGNQEVERAGFRGIMNAYLERLGAEFNEVCYASAVIEAGKAICIDKRELDAGHQIRMLAVTVGSLINMYASSSGKSMLAFTDQKKLPEIMAGFEFTSFTATTVRNPEELLKQLEEVRRKGYALDEGERLDGIYCIAVPILNSDGLSHGSIAVSGLRENMLEKKPRLLPSMIQAAVEASRLFGAPASKMPEGWKL